MELDKYIGQTAALISADANEYRFGLEGVFMRECDGRYGITMRPGQYFFFAEASVKATVELGDRVIIYL